jgi:hypothetical protein
MSDQMCVWNLGSECDGDIADVGMIGNQVTVPICAKHLHQHKCIMALHSKGYDVEEVLNQTPEWREEEIVKVGIDLNTVQP